MKREQIEKKAKEWCKQYIECDGNCRWCPNERYKDYFIEGADWLLSNQWVSVEDELPPAMSKCDPISDRVLVHTSFDCVFVDHYDHNYDEWLTAKKDNNNVTHWMPLPPLAEEGGEK